MNNIHLFHCVYSQVTNIIPRKLYPPSFIPRFFSPPKFLGVWCQIELCVSLLHQSGTSLKS